MKSVQTTYCTYKFLEDTIDRCKTSRPHKIAYKILQNLSDIVIDSNEEKFKIQAENNHYYKELMKRENMSIKCIEAWKDKIDFSNISGDLFLIDPEYLPDYKRMRKEKGCLVVASGGDIHYLERLNDKRGYVFIVPKKNKEDKKNKLRDSALSELYQSSWQEAIKTCPLTPINSLIISDNFIFDKFEQRKHSSLFSLLKAVIPEQLAVPFHLAIFSHLDKALPKIEAEKLIGEIKEMFPNLKDKDNIKVTIISHTVKMTTHDREMLSNYHIMVPGHGFSIMDEEDAVQITKGYIEPVYHAIENNPDVFLTPKLMQYQIINWLKPIFNGEKGTAQTSYIVGDRIHRLLED